MSVPRIAISPSRFDISPPGSNVFTTSTNNLIFQGFGGVFPCVYMKGIYNASSNTGWTIVSPAGQTNPQVSRLQIPFGKAFAQAPDAIVHIYGSVNGVVCGFMNYWNILNNNTYQISYSTTTTTLDIYVSVYINNLQGYQWLALTIGYIVYQN